jgi:hypothetical protein
MESNVPKPSLHIMFGGSGAGSLRHALGRDSEVAALYDDFSFGPIADADGTARTRWVEEILGFDWQDVVVGNAPFLDQTCSLDVAPIAWFSRRDAQSYNGFLWLLSHLGNQPCKIVDVTDCISTDGHYVATPSALLAGELRDLLDSEAVLTDAERADHSRLWEQLRTDDAPLRVIDVQGKLVSAPIHHFDPLLISRATPEWRKMAWIIGTTLAQFSDDGVRQTNDLVLHSRLCALAEAGRLEWRGDMNHMHQCEMRLPR